MQGHQGCMENFPRRQFNGRLDDFLSEFDFKFYVDPQRNNRQYRMVHDLGTKNNPQWIFRLYEHRTLRSLHWQ